MILMENGRMDSNSKVTSESNHFIMGIGGKSAKSCFNSSSLTFTNADNNNSLAPVKSISSIENNFSNYNGNKVDCCESLNLINGDNNCSKCDKNSYKTPIRTNSSQCTLTSVNNSLENDISTLNISSREETCEVSSEYNCNQCSNFDSKKYDEHLRDKSAECMQESQRKESNEACNKILSEVENNQKSDYLADSCSIQSTDTQSSHFGELEKEEKEDNSTSEIMYISYESEHQMPDIMRLIQKDLSEPYSIYTYRYFIHNWPHLCFLAVGKGKSVGAIVCKLDLHRKVIKRGYIAMLAVDESYRKQGIGSNLVLKAIRVMTAEGADEVVLETEITNQPALRLYENLGFVRDKRLFRYYLNGVDALRLKLWLR